MTRHLLALPFAALLLIAAGKADKPAKPDPRTETEHVVAKGETLSQIAERAGRTAFRLRVRRSRGWRDPPPAEPS